MVNLETIKCSKCGWDTGISTGPIHMVIQPPGIKCPNCNIIIISVPSLTLNDEAYTNNKQNITIEDIINKPQANWDYELEKVTTEHIAEVCDFILSQKGK